MVQVVRESFATSLVPAPGGEFGALLPEGYSTNHAPYPLVLSLHGGGQDREILLTENKDLYVSAMQNGTLPPCVVVMPSCARSNYLNTYDKSERWEDHEDEENCET